MSLLHLLFIRGWLEGRNGAKNKERVYIRCCFSIPVIFLFLEKYTTHCQKFPAGSPHGLDFETLIRDTLGPTLFSFLYSADACGNKLIKAGRSLALQTLQWHKTKRQDTNTIMMLEYHIFATWKAANSSDALINAFSIGTCTFLCIWDVLYLLVILWLQMHIIVYGNIVRTKEPCAFQYCCIPRVLCRKWGGKAKC